MSCVAWCGGCGVVAWHLADSPVLVLPDALLCAVCYALHSFTLLCRYNLIHNEDFELFKELAEEHPEILEERDPTGATALHLLLLHNDDTSIAVVQDILQEHPDLCRVQYTGDQYFGESLLHIAIIKSCVDVVRLLLRLCPELLELRATGDFFKPDNPCYYGELPLSFAVCTNQGNLVQILLDAGADPTLTDGAGNNAAHMAVLHGMRE